MIPTWLNNLMVKFRPHKRASVAFETPCSEDDLAYPGYLDDAECRSCAFGPRDGGIRFCASPVECVGMKGWTPIPKKEKKG